MTTGNGSLDRLLKIGSIIVSITLAYAALQAQVMEVQKNKVETTRFLLDSANTSNRLGTLEQVLLKDVQQLNRSQRAICRKLSIECQ